MNIPALHSRVKVAEIPLDKLAGNAQLTEAEKIGEVSRQFEAILLRQILAAGQKTAFRSTMNPESSASDIYRDMMTNQLADQISRSGGLGLGGTLATQLDRQLKLPAAGDKAGASHE